MGVERDNALFMSCDRWNRFHEAGIINFCVGKGYGVLVVNMTATDGPEDDVEAIFVLR